MTVLAKLNHLSRERLCAQTRAYEAAESDAEPTFLAILALRYDHFEKALIAGVAIGCFAKKVHSLNLGIKTNDSTLWTNGPAESPRALNPWTA